MTKAENFISTSDYATLKNDSSGNVLTLNIKAFDSVPAATSPSNPGIKRYEATVLVGRKNASIRARGQFNGGAWFVCTNLQVMLRVYTPATGNINHTTAASLERVDENLMRLYLDVVNFAPQVMTIARDDTVTFNFSTFLSPFQ